MCCLCSVQVGADCPDVVPSQLKAAWECVQSLISQGLVSAGHDISDGGIATALLEMAFAGVLLGWSIVRQGAQPWAYVCFTSP